VLTERELSVELELDAFVIILEIKLGVGLFNKLPFRVEGSFPKRPLRQSFL